MTNVIMVYIGIGITKPVEPLLITIVEALDEYLSSNHGTYFVGPKVIRLRLNKSRKSHLDIRLILRQLQYFPL